MEQSESDVRDYKVTVSIACPSCGKVETAEIPAETAYSLEKRDDGVLIDDAECAECVDYFEHYRAGKPL